MFGHGLFIGKEIVVHFRKRIPMQTKNLLIILFVCGGLLYAQTSQEKAIEVEKKAFELSASEKIQKMFNNKNQRIDIAKKQHELSAKYKNLKREIFKEKQFITYEDGKVTFLDRDREDSILTHERTSSDYSPYIKDIMSTNDKIYIFMSSSVPRKVWINYAKILMDHKLNNATMLLRGCIGGCEKIKPTIKFFRDIVESQEPPLQANMHIDPLLFEKYKIKEAPCVVYAKNIDFINPELSQGLEHNILTEGKKYMSCGDWTLSYHFRLISEQSQDKEIKKLYNKLIRNGY